MLVRSARLWLSLTAAICMVVFLVVGSTNAQNTDGAFSLQVSPSPLVTSVRPSEQKSLELQIKNNATSIESLKMDLRKFNVNENGEVQLTDEEPTEVSKWVGFEKKTFNIEPGKIFNQKVVLTTPNDVSYSYSFVITVSRVQEPNQSTQSGNRIKGTVAIFTLINIDRPGATRKLDVIQFSSPRRLYEYLPTSFQVKIKNAGNSIVQPFGNIYIQRSSKSSEPISVLTLNDSGGYILPDSNRTFNLSWEEGFPIYKKTKVAENIPESSKLVWDWSNAQKFRFGKYTAKLVAVYNDGQRDIPIESEINFWVISWKLIGLMLIIFSILIVGSVTIIKKGLNPIRTRKKNRKLDEDNSSSDN